MRVEPLTRIVGHIAVPGDKSISHRAVLLGALCDGETRVSGFGRSADTEATIEAVRALGVTVYEHDDDTLRIFGNGLRGLTSPGRPIDCANAGTLVRLLAGILAGQQGQRFELTGDASLSTRPMKRVTEPLARMGAGVETDDGHLPLGIVVDIAGPQLVLARSGCRGGHKLESIEWIVVIDRLPTIGIDPARAIVCPVISIRCACLFRCSLGNHYLGQIAHAIVIVGTDVIVGIGNLYQPSNPVVAVLRA